MYCLCGMGRDDRAAGWGHAIGSSNRANLPHGPAAIGASAWCHLPGSMERGTVSILSRATPMSFPRFAESAGHNAACNPRGGRGPFSLHLGDTLPQSSRGVVFPIRSIDPGGVGRFAQSTPVGSETAKRATAAQRTSSSRIARLWIAIELNETAAPAAVIAHVSHGIPFSDTATALPNRAIETGAVMIVEMMDLRRAPIKPEISMSVSLSVGAVEGVVSSSSGARDRRWCRRERSRRR